MTQCFHHIFQAKRRYMLAPMRIEHDLHEQCRRAVSPRLRPPILLGQQMAFAEREAPELGVRQAEALPLKAPEGLPGDTAKGSVSATSLPSGIGTGTGLAACHA